MISAAIGISTWLSAEKAAESAVRDALDGLAPAYPSAALVFATDAWGDGLGDLVDAVRQKLSTPITGGGTVEGLWTARHGTSHNPAVAVMLLAGVTVDSILLDGIAGEEAETGEELLAYLGDNGNNRDLLFLLLDSESLLPEPLLAGMAAELHRGQRVAGLGLSAVTGGACHAWLGDNRRSGAVLGMRIRAEASTYSASACRHLEPTRTVSRARGNWILGLDGRPAYEVMCEVVDALQLGDPADALQHLFVALSNGKANAVANTSAGIRLRKIVSVDLARGAIGVPEPMASGMSLQFAIQDEVGARDNLASMLAAAADTRPAFGLFLASSVRGRSPFGGLEREARTISRCFPETPILGLHGAFQLAGGLAGEPGCEILTHAGILALIDP